MSMHGRTLAAGIECGGGRELSVMSSHLESFISKQETSSAERVRQMKDSLKVLDGGGKVPSTPLVRSLVRCVITASFHL